MKTEKKIISFILSFVLCLTLFSACGSEKKKDENADKSLMETASKQANIAALDSLEDAFRMLGEYTEGSYDYSLSVWNTDDSKAETDVKIRLYGDSEKNAQNSSLEIDVNCEGKNYVKKLENFLCRKDNRLYIDLDKVMSLIIEKKTSFGSFGMLLPETDMKEAQIYYSEALEISSRFLAAACEGLEIEKNIGKYYVHIRGIKDLKLVAQNVFAWLENNKDDVVDLIYASKDYSNVIDVKKYAEALIDEYYDEICASFRLISKELQNGNMGMLEMVFGSKETLKNQVLQLLDEAYSDVDNAFDKEKLKKELDGYISELKKEYEENVDVIGKKYPKLEETDLTLGIELDSDAYILIVSGVLPCGECSVNIEAKAKYVQKPVEIEKPDNEKKLSEIVEYALDNKEELLQAFQKAEGLINKLRTTMVKAE